MVVGGVSGCGALVTGVGGVKGRKSELSGEGAAVTAATGAFVTSVRLLRRLSGLTPKTFVTCGAWTGVGAGGAGVVGAGGLTITVDLRAGGAAGSVV